jgi:hypothetical protein
MPVNKFKSWWDAGYRNLLPVVPPDAPTDPNSHIKHGRGKSPGVLYSNGLWAGFKGWSTHETTPQDVANWTEMGASVGLRFGDQWLLDIDAYDPEIGDQIEADALRMLGPAPLRVGQWPKRALLYRNAGDIRKQKLHFSGKNGEVNAIEVPPQTVVEGVHARTGKPYAWPRKPVPADQLTPVTGAMLDAFMEAMRKKLPNAQKQDGGGSEPVSQSSLAGNPKVIADLVKRLPNDRQNFPGWSDMVKVGYAIKASLPDDPDLALDLWHDWCSRWEGGDYEHDKTDMVWGSLKPPFRVGASWLYEMGDKLLQGPQDASFAAMAQFEVVTPESLPEPSPFEVQERQIAFSGEAPLRLAATPYGFPDVSAIPCREFLYGTHYIRKFVSATVAPSGVGKSSLEIVEALAMASGKPLLGVRPKAPLRVWLWNGEDPMDELQRRVAAGMLHYGLTREDLDGRLWLDTGREQEIVLATETREGARIATPVVDALIRTIQENRIDVFQVDPFVSSHRVSENDNGAIDLVTKQWAKVANITNCAVELVHHVRKLNGAEITVEDSRGAVALIATSRSARALTKMQKAEATRLGIEKNYQRFFRFGDGKNNLALPATDKTEWMELVSVPLGNGAGSGLDAVMNGDSVGVVAVRRIEEATAAVDLNDREAAFAAIRAGEWRQDVQTRDAWVGNPIAQALGLDLSSEDDRAKVKALLKGWIKDRSLVAVSRLDASRRQRVYVEVAKHTDNLSGDVFG